MLQPGLSSGKPAHYLSLRGSYFFRGRSVPPAGDTNKKGTTMPPAANTMTRDYAGGETRVHRAGCSSRFLVACSLCVVVVGHRWSLCFYECGLAVRPGGQRLLWQNMKGNILPTIIYSPKGRPPSGHRVPPHTQSHTRKTRSPLKKKIRLPDSARLTRVSLPGGPTVVEGGELCAGARQGRVYPPTQCALSSRVARELLVKTVHIHTAPTAHHRAASGCRIWVWCFSGSEMRVLREGVGVCVGGGEGPAPWRPEEKISILNLRTSEIHLFYNLQFFYWHFLEILWLFIFLILYLSALLFSRARRERGGGRVAGRFLKELKYKYKPIKDYKR